jgi:hypothetical protein
MLSSLGDLILALCRPEVAEQLERLRLEKPTKIPKAELALLERPLPAIAAAMAKHRHLHNGLVQLLEKNPSGRRHGRKTINKSWKVLFGQPMNLVIVSSTLQGSDKTKSNSP